MRQFKKVLPQESVNVVERAAMELTARQGVIDRYLDKHKDDVDASALDSKPFIHFMTLLAESESEYQLAQERIGEEFVPKFLADYNASWELQYSNCTLTITVNGEAKDLPELKGFEEVPAEKIKKITCASCGE